MHSPSFIEQGTSKGQRSHVKYKKGCSTEWERIRIIVWIYGLCRKRKRKVGDLTMQFRLIRPSFGASVYQSNNCDVSLFAQWLVVVLGWCNVSENWTRLVFVHLYISTNVTKRWNLNRKN